MKIWKISGSIEDIWMHWSKLGLLKRFCQEKKIKIVGQCQPYGFNENEWKYICSQCSSLNFLGFHKIKLELTLSLHLHMYPIFLLLRTYPFFLMYTSPHPHHLSRICTSSLPSCNFFSLKEISFLHHQFHLKPKIEYLYWKQVFLDHMIIITILLIL